MPKRIRVRIDRARCVGAAMCVAIVPSVFQVDEEGKATVLTDTMDYSDRMLRAAEECPATAVIIDEVAD